MTEEQLRVREAAYQARVEAEAEETKALADPQKLDELREEYSGLSTRQFQGLAPEELARLNYLDGLRRRGIFAKGSLGVK